MIILVLGANGQVGREIIELAKTQVTSPDQVLGLGSRELDITKARAVQNTLGTLKPSVVINAAAYTAVDKAESESDRAFAVNRDGAGNIAQSCANLNIPMLHISTDYVFDGTKSSAYTEQDLANPQCVYGVSKWQGEQRVREILEQHIILRTSWVFGRYGHNFVYSMIALAQQQPELRIVNDQHGCPTCATAIADVLLTVSNAVQNDTKGRWGVYHYCGTPATTWFDFCSHILDASREDYPYLVQQIVPIESKDFPTPAIRPENSVLNCDKIQQVFGIDQQPWDTGLRDMLQFWRENILKNDNKEN